MKHRKMNGIHNLHSLEIDWLTFLWGSSHKYTLYLSTDGNFRLQQKNKRGDPDDVALNDGNGYFVETEAYKKYVKHVGECSDVSGSIPLIPPILNQDLSEMHLYAPPRRSTSEHQVQECCR